MRHPSIGQLSTKGITANAPPKTVFPRARVDNCCQFIDEPPRDRHEEYRTGGEAQKQCAELAFVEFGLGREQRKTGCPGSDAGSGGKEKKR